MRHLLAVFLALTLAACSGTSNIPTQTPEQKLAIVKVTYGSALNTLSGLADSGVISDEQVLDAAKATTAIDALIAETDALIAADGGFDLLETKITAIKVLVEQLTLLITKFQGQAALSAPTLLAA